MAAFLIPRVLNLFGEELMISDLVGRDPSPAKSDFFQIPLPCLTVKLSEIDVRWSIKENEDTLLNLLISFTR